ncbi:MAG: Serine/threonine-protein kinase PrkC [Verrucomicrobia bacterium ADurb.Bin018]|nr:MAG: Serine/threonine-protein kinase PrkC [Verrucomicrobia bacterium ADurb.Bin018]
MVKIGDNIILPELSGAAGTATPNFRVADIMAGGMGTCLKIVHSENETAYAVKLIRPELMENDLAWRRFIDELKLCFTLSESTGVVEAICLARLNEIPCLCSPWMQGGTLRSRMRAGDCSPAFVYSAIARVLHTLDWVEKKHKSVHRDLKPENILHDEKGLAYISDWGLAKLVERQLRKCTNETMTAGNIDRPGATQAGSFLGTIYYASPEQILGQHEIDFRSDIYSLGCIMYELESGKPPFTGRTVGEIATHHLRDKAPGLGAGLFRRTNLGLERIIERCLLKEPNERFQNYEELLGEVGRVANKRRIDISESSPKMRQFRPAIGRGEFHKTVDIRKDNAPCGVVDLVNIMPYIEECEALIALGQWGKAKDILAPLYDPEIANPDAKWNMGHTIALNYATCLVKCMRAKEAVNIFEPLARMNDLPAEYYVNYSLALLHNHDSVAAEQICAAGLKKSPTDKDLLGNYVIALQSQNKLSDALHYLEARLKGGRNVHSLEEAAAVMIRLADEYGEQDWNQYTDYMKMALRYLTEAKHQNPRFLSARYTLASVLLKLELYENAADEFKEVVNMAGKGNVHGQLAISQIGRLLLETGSYKECVDYCIKWMPELNDSIMLNRTMAMAIADGWVVDKSGKRIVVPQSIDYFEKAVRRENTQVEEYCYLAELYARMNRHKEAEALFVEAEAKHPRNWLVPYYRGLAKYLAGLNDEAINNMQKASQLAPLRSEPDWKMGQVYCALGNIEMGETMKKSSEDKKSTRKKIAEDGLPSA